MEVESEGRRGARGSGKKENRVQGNATAWGKRRKTGEDLEGMHGADLENEERGARVERVTKKPSKD